jgi:putative ABC transport system ATP-binding protein
MSTELIRLVDVSKIYGMGEAAVVALNHVNLRIAAGEFVAILGPSGSGKSTAMNILGCLDTPTSGHYYFRGFDVGALTRDQRALLRRNYLGFVFQGFNLLKRTSALENLELPLIYRGTRRKDRHELARKALALVGLSDREAHTASELSGGQQQRVAIARALAQQPTVILADEPVASLDPKIARQVLGYLREAARELGITVLCNLHQVEYAKEFSERVVGMSRGSVVFEGPPAQLTDEILHRIYYREPGEAVPEEA